MSVTERVLRIRTATPDPESVEAIPVLVGGDLERNAITIVRERDGELLVDMTLDEASDLVDHLLDLLAEAGWHR